MPSNRGNGWAEWGRHVLAELERLDNCYHNVDAQNKKLLTEITILKIKSGLFGIIGGAIPVLITIGIALVMLYLKS